jgi:hypothetical protein
MLVRLPTESANVVGARTRLIKELAFERARISAIAPPTMSGHSVQGSPLGFLISTGPLQWKADLE